MAVLVIVLHDEYMILVTVSAAIISCEIAFSLTSCQLSDIHTSAAASSGTVVPRPICHHPHPQTVSRTCTEQVHVSAAAFGAQGADKDEGFGVWLGRGRMGGGGGGGGELQFDWFCAIS